MFLLWRRAWGRRSGTGFCITSQKSKMMLRQSLLAAVFQLAQAEIFHLGGGSGLTLAPRTAQLVIADEYFRNTKITFNGDQDMKMHGIVLDATKLSDLQFDFCLSKPYVFGDKIADIHRYVNCGLSQKGFKFICVSFVFQEDFCNFGHMCKFRNAKIHLGINVEQVNLKPQQPILKKCKQKYKQNFSHKLFWHRKFPELKAGIQSPYLREKDNYRTYVTLPAKGIYMLGIMNCGENPITLNTTISRGVFCHNTEEDGYFCNSTPLARGELKNLENLFTKEMTTYLGNLLSVFTQYRKRI